MNIMFFMPTVLVGGVRTVTEILSRRFRERGHKVYWLLLYRIYGDERDYPEGENCVYLPSRQLLSQVNIDFYNKYVKDYGIDVVINQNGLYEGIDLIDQLNDRNVLRISVLHNNPILNYKWLFKDQVSLRGDTLADWLKMLCRFILYPRTRYIIYRGIVNQINKLYIGRSHINVLSPKYIQTVQEINSHITDISAIPNPNTYESVKSVAKERLVIYVGRLDNRSKKVNYLLKIWRSVQRSNRDWKLIVIGDGPDAANLKKQAQNIPNIEFAGYQPPREYYERASILCMTSIYEGFPMTLTESMQHGCVPIIYGTFPAAQDIITNGINGIVVKPFNEREYVSQLLMLMEDDDYRNRMSVSASSMSKRFNSNNIADQWIELFQKLKGK